MAKSLLKKSTKHLMRGLKFSRGGVGASSTGLTRHAYAASLRKRRHLGLGKQDRGNMVSIGQRYS